jgi:hypothetical protein
MLRERERGRKRGENVDRKTIKRVFITQLKVFSVKRTQSIGVGDIMNTLVITTFNSAEEDYAYPFAFAFTVTFSVRLFE